MLDDYDCEALNKFDLMLKELASVENSETVAATLVVAATVERTGIRIAEAIDLLTQKGGSDTYTLADICSVLSSLSLS